MERRTWTMDLQCSRVFVYMQSNVSVRRSDLYCSLLITSCSGTRIPYGKKVPYTSNAYWIKRCLPQNKSLKGAIRSQMNCVSSPCDVITDWKIWVNCAVLTGNSADLRTVLSSRFFTHTELRSSLRETHSFLSLTADTTMASSQGTHPS